MREFSDKQEKFFINVDSEFDYKRILAAYRGTGDIQKENLKFILRFNPDVEEMSQIHPYVATALTKSKFGMNYGKDRWNYLEHEISGFWRALAY